MNNAHLSDKEIYSMIIEPETVDMNLQLHLKKCQDCRKRLNKIKAITKAFQEQIEDTEINWVIEKGRILSTISDHRLPVMWGRWRTAVIVSFIVIVSAFLFKQIYVQPKNDIKIEETELLKEIRIFAPLERKSLYLWLDGEINNFDTDLTGLWYTNLLTGFTEVRGEVELPQSILFLAEWEGEDFRQFLNFFSPIEEEIDEKKDFINDSLSNNRGDQFLFA